MSALNCVFLLILFVFFTGRVNAEATIFHYRIGESNNDVRYEYDFAALKLALDKTKAQYGEYELKAIPSVNIPRAIEYARKNTFQNLFIKLSYEKSYDSMLKYAHFPVDLGVVGFRVCFVSPLGKELLKSVENLDQLKSLSHVQGSGWSDVEILRFNGFKVETASGYENLFRMIAANRADLFCRGANEIYDEYRIRTSIENLNYDTSMAIVYPLPRFFYTNIRNVEAAKRVTKGLERAYSDGSLVSLWEKYYGENFKFSNLKERRIYRIENPLLNGLESHFQKYLYPPLKELK
ncbi:MULTISPECIES: hypothetical protein [unclassified Neptuniibacter]|uniref:hypothetical protein n=1 Tax=unclassified Neptuniibacter TaxID=2630693 RepID=UPI000C4BA3E3|nr:MULTISPECIES: hypothetical protein [unclassified Neptuniibacter]MAY43382.1 hypothetical protein [Oceanospirillaceae bacterium]|tara:strand:- start:35043 stop:35921 length:879 start_codon:yes stop_codon:yes gene_type:complete